MKYNLIIATLFVFFLGSCEEKKEESNQEETTVIQNGVTISTFKVWGNCEMCKKTIEKSLQVDGIKKADWNIDTKIMTVQYNPSVITLDQIEKDMANVGYDNMKYKGNDSAYKELPECCQYERK